MSHRNVPYHLLREDFRQIEASVIALGYQIIDDSGDPKIKPDPEDTVRVWGEMNPGDHLTGSEVYYLEQALKWEFFIH